MFHRLLLLASALLVACSSTPPAPATPPPPPEPVSAPVSSTRGTVAIPPAPDASGWSCFVNERTPNLDNGCGISPPDCRREIERHTRSASRHGIAFEPSSCRPSSEAYCFWVELSAERLGYVCALTSEACSALRLATTYHLRSDCLHATTAAPGYLGPN